MGLLVAGEWVDQWYKSSAKGEFVRQDSQFRNWITADGAAGPTGSDGFKAEAGRYHLYISLACPWAHRTLIFLTLKGLQDVISVSIVEPLMLDKGWYFDAEQGDGLYGLQYLHQIYRKAQPDITTRVTVPVLWDKRRNTIVSNESADIIRMFNTAFNSLTGNTEDYYPVALREEIDSLNDRIYHRVNNGVYRSGFATTQSAYEEAYYALFEELDCLETLLAGRRYLTGNTITEADWRLFTTLVRFDAVYFGHFKTNRQRIADYPSLSEYVRDLYQQPGIAETVDMPYIKQHYYGSHSTINPTAIVPVGQELDFSVPHQRQRFSEELSAASS
ncbi:glutathione S-transferase family protein [Oceanicoccus sagamiensis]|uniref:Glutathione-dependent reductase n=1 Tax=Oceanicoccus sagamiensis TaxID=716816 RepID=A0A1X9NC07_9GAMM|nr:glutathione S-transferase family protein [Oceanicoccus sagamiensis]ARN74711.1 glutathione-dependent reductase [Oceanicoccus sagamiensis]